MHVTGTETTLVGCVDVTGTESTPVGVIRTDVVAAGWPSDACDMMSSPSDADELESDLCQTDMRFLSPTSTSSMVITAISQSFL